MLMFDFDQLEKKNLLSLQEAYDEAIYCHNIRLALSELADALEENNKYLTESDEDITKAINYLVPKFRRIASIEDNSALIIETETLFNTTPVDHLVYLGVVLTSFLKNIPDKTYVDIYTHSKNFTYETGTFDKTKTFDCVCDKYRFFFNLKKHGGDSSVLKSFWKKKVIIYDTAKISFIPNNNNDITLNIIKGNTTFMFRGLKENRKVANFIYELLKDNQNLIEAINSHLNKQFGLDMKVISPYYSFL